MEYRKLGRCDLNVSEIGLGGEWLNEKTQEEVADIIHTSKEEGINFIDVFMPQAQTRDNIGKALEGIREDFIIQGHFCTVFEDEQYNRTRDYKKTVEGFEDLLYRLKTDYIDIGMIHYVDSQEDYDSVFNTEIIQYVKEQKRIGKIKYIGLSSHNPKIALKAVKTGLIDVLMFSINPAYDMESPDTEVEQLIEFNGISKNGLIPDEERMKLYNLCENEGVGITVMKALGAGSLLDKNLSPFGITMTVPQCIEYCLDRNGVRVVIIGCDNPQQVRSAVGYYNTPKEEKDYTHIFKTDKKIVVTGKCMYCNHCLPCPKKIDIASVTKFNDLATIHKNVPETVQKHYESMTTNADDCILCGVCEKRCPFAVNIRENMKAAQKTFRK